MEKWIISGNSRKFSTFVPKIWILQPLSPLTVVAGTKYEEMSLKSTEKIRAVSLSQNYLVLTKKKCRPTSDKVFHLLYRIVLRDLCGNFYYPKTQ